MPVNSGPLAYLDKVTKCVQCDITALVNIPRGYPLPGQPLPTLAGVSVAQIRFAENSRISKLNEWKSDLPEEVLGALKTITDPGYWIKHKNIPATDIGWPEQWTDQRNREVQSESQPTVAPPPSTAVMQAANSPDTALFEEFARKVSNSPELAYLTILALMHRHLLETKLLVAADEIKARFEESRQRVGGHLEAIDKMLR